MAMTELQAECSQGERINYFLANRLDSQSRQAFVAHVGVCDLCASLLRDLHEDERLARIPLTAEERSRIRAIVHEGREEVSVRLDEDRRQRRPSPAEAPAPRFRLCWRRVPGGFSGFPSRRLRLLQQRCGLLAAVECLIG